MEHDQQQATSLRRKVLHCVWLAGTLYCTAGFAEPPSSESNQQTASRAMLDFLTEFSDLDDSEFDLIAAYAEKDAQLDNNPEGNSEIAPSNKSNANLEQPDQIDD